MDGDFSQAADSQFKVQRANTDEERREIFRLRYRVYVEEMGLRPAEANHAEKLITDDWDRTAVLVYVRLDDQVVGTVRGNYCSNTPLPDVLRQAFCVDRFLEKYPAESVTIATKFIVAPAWRNSVVAGLLIAQVCQDSLGSNVHFNLLHCAPALIALYEQMGYRRFTKNFVHEDVGFQVPMVMLWEDVEHLKAVRSPFLRMARNLTNRADIVEWFRGAFPEQSQFVNSRMFKREAFWHELGRMLNQPPVQGIALFRGLEDAEVQRFIRSAAVHRATQGETLLRPGDTGREMFVVLSGLVDVVGVASGRDFGIRTLGPGEVFGEMSLFLKAGRTARVVATADAEVLIITEKSLQSALETTPATVARIMMNLTRSLCERLDANTQALMTAKEAPK